MNRPTNAYVGTEDAFQVSAMGVVRRIARTAGYIPECVMHVPNGGNRGKIYGAKLKAAGVVAGYPDIMVFVPKMTCAVPPIHIYVGLAFELKVWPNKPTAEQLLVHDILRGAGWHILTCWSLDAVISATNEYFAR